MVRDMDIVEQSNYDDFRAMWYFLDPEGKRYLTPTYTFESIVDACALL